MLYFYLVCSNSAAPRAPRPATRTSPKSGTWWSARSLWVVCLVALVVRLLGIDSRDPWVDEANAILISEAPVNELVGKLTLDSSPPLYFLALKGWGRLFGRTLLSYRALSTLGGVLLVALTHTWGGQLVGRRAGTWSAAFLALAPIAVFHSQQARPYTWTALTVFVSTVALVRFVQDGSTWWRIAWIGTTLAALYLHATCLYVLPVHVVIVLVSRKRRETQTWLLPAMAITVGFAPWLPTLFTQLTSNHYDFFLSYWSRMGPLGAIGETVLTFSPAGERVLYANEASNWFGIPAICGLFVASIGAVTLVRQCKQTRVWLGLWPLLLTLVPLVLGALGSLLVTPHYVPSRFDQVALPGFALLLGLGVQAIDHAKARAAIVGTMGAISILTLVQRGTREFHHGNRALAAAVHEFYSGGDAIICTSVTRGPLEFLLRDVPSDRFVSYPVHGKHHLGNFDPTELLESPTAAAQLAQATLTDALRKAGPDSEVIIVRALVRANEMFEPAVFARFGVTPKAIRGSFVQTGYGELAVVEVYDARRLRGKKQPNAR